MKEHYDFTKARPNPYAKRMKNGYSVAIHCQTPEDADDESMINTIQALLKQPRLNALHLYVKKNDDEDSDCPTDLLSKEEFSCA